MNNYTAHLTSVKTDIENPNVSVSTIEFYKDGVLLLTDIERGFSSLSHVQNYCRQKIEQLSEQDAINAFVATPPLGEIDLAIAPPSPEEMATQMERERIAMLRTLKERVELKLIDQAVYDSALADIQLDIKP